MAITEQRQPIYLVSQNKYICLWYWQLALASNAWVVKASKLVDRIDLGSEKECNPVEVFLDLEELDVDDLGDYSQPMTNLAQPYVDPSLAIY